MKSISRIATLPLYFERPRSDNIPVTITWYRNAHYQTLRNVKSAYNEKIVGPQLEGCSPISTPLFVVFVLYVPDRSRRDLDNFVDIQKKFFMDVMVKEELIPEDSVFYVPMSVDLFGGIDKENPRVDVYASPDFKLIGQLIRRKLCPDQLLITTQI